MRIHTEAMRNIRRRKRGDSYVAVRLEETHGEKNKCCLENSRGTRRGKSRSGVLVPRNYGKAIRNMRHKSTLLPTGASELCQIFEGVEACESINWKIVY